MIALLRHTYDGADTREQSEGQGYGIGGTEGPMVTPWILLWDPVPRGILQAGIHAGERGYLLGIMGITHPVFAMF